MTDLFLADAHLRDPSEPHYQSLLQFLENQHGRVRTLYLLGDIFEFWIGYRHLVFAAYVPLLEALRRLRASGCQIVFVEGNHDFRMGPAFSDALGARILPDGGEVEIDGRRVQLVHGDLIAGQDRGYRLWRAFLRSRLTTLLQQLVPADLVWRIGMTLSDSSHKRSGAENRNIDPTPLLEPYAQACFAAGCQAVITGHFHQPRLTQQDDRLWLSLGAWCEGLHYARWKDGQFTLHRYSDPTA